MKTFRVPVILIALLWIGAKTLQGQVNLLAAYDLGYIEIAGTNQILDEFDANNVNGKGFKNIRFLNGLSFGVSYKLDWFTFQGLYKKRFAIREAESAEYNNIIGDYRFIYGLNTIATGVELGEKWSFGTHVHFNTLVFNSRFGPSGNVREQRSKDKNISFRIYSSLELTNNRLLSFKIQPFIEIFQKAFEIRHDLLYPGILKEKPFMVGLTILFENGPQ